MTTASEKTSRAYNSTLNARLRVIFKLTTMGAPNISGRGLESLDRK